MSIDIPSRLMIVSWIVLGLVAAVLLTAALLPARHAITRSTTIARPPRVVFDAIADLNRYREWNPWQKSEPESRQTVTGEPGVAGHAYAWDGKKIGAGSLTPRKTVPGEASNSTCASSGRGSPRPMTCGASSPRATAARASPGPTPAVCPTRRGASSDRSAPRRSANSSSRGLASLEALVEKG